MKNTDKKVILEAETSTKTVILKKQIADNLAFSRQSTEMSIVKDL